MTTKVSTKNETPKLQKVNNGKKEIEDFDLRNF